MEVRANISALPTARSAGKPVLQIGQPEIIRPSITAYRGPMGAPKIRAIDQQAANTCRAHLGEGDFLAARLLHGPMMMPLIEPRVKPLDIGGRHRRDAKNAPDWPVSRA